MNEIRSKFVKESLLDYEALANSLKENTSNAVRDLLKEAVRERYNEILSEADENEFEVEEVEDTESAPTNDAEGAESETPSEDGVEDDATKESDETPVEVADKDVATEIGDDSDDSTEWAEFDQFKVGDGEYDFSQADDDAIVKVYKLLRNEDEVMVNVDKEANKVEIKDNETGAEYLIDMGASEKAATDVAPIADEPMELNDASGDLDLENEDMNESRIYEVVLNEYDSHVGYTDNYQKKDVMTTPSMKEPGKNVNDWDAGVPKGSEKPWVGKKGDSAPFNEEEEVAEETIEEAGMNVGGFVQQNSTSRSNVPNSNGRKARNMHQGAKQVKGTAEPRYQGATNESKKMMAKVNQILKENEELKSALGKFKTVLQEAAVTNLSLGNIIKLISENSTTKEEKQEIIARFGKECKTIEESKNLYESISRELQKRNTMNINEDKQFTTNGSKQINETTIYKSKDIDDTLDLMNRVCR